jgi:hypothetical protein
MSTQRASDNGAKQAGLWEAYKKRVMELEREGMVTSDAQAVVDVEFEALHGRGWERKADRHSNPGGWSYDDSGTQPPPRFR